MSDEDQSSLPPPANPTAAAIRRLQKELQELMMAPQCSNSSQAAPTAFPESDDIFVWLATLIGPEGTPFHGLELQLRFTFPPEYPFKPPKVVFLTPCFHPNVALSTGDVCLDILQTQWSAVLSVSSVLVSLQSLLGSPNIFSPLNTDAASMWPGCPEKYRHHVLLAMGLPTKPPTKAGESDPHSPTTNSGVGKVTPLDATATTVSSEAYFPSTPNRSREPSPSHS